MTGLHPSALAEPQPGCRTTVAIGAIGRNLQGVGMSGTENRMQPKSGRLSWVGAAGLVGLLLTVSACSVVTGSGQTASEPRPVTEFSRVELADAGDVTISQGEANSLTIEADEKVLPVLTSDVVDGTLRLGHKSGTTVVSDSPIRYHVTIEDLTGIELSGAGRVTGRDLRVESLDVDVTGAGMVDLSGSVNHQDVRLSGTGRYQAGDLVSQVATADLSGSGQMLLAVDRQLTVTISGAGTISYTGAASVEKSISGIGQLIKR